MSVRMYLSVYVCMHVSTRVKICCLNLIPRAEIQDPVQLKVFGAAETLNP